MPWPIHQACLPLLLLTLGCIPDGAPAADPSALDLDGDGVAADEDCDDTDDRVAPGLDELCDGLDNDCDAQIDEEPVDGVHVFADLDGDGFGAGEPTLGCRPDVGRATMDGDCDDARSDIYPSAEERCDEADQDCDGAVDEDPIDAPLWYVDTDGDGYGSDAVTMASCTQPEHFVDNSDDCGPSDADVSPAGAEVCDERGVDEDCDGLVDDDDPDATGQPIWYADADGDGLGGAELEDRACAAPRGAASAADDCDDSDPAVLGQSLVYVDLDGDGYGDGGAALVLACARAAGVSTEGTDCDDADDSVHPGRVDPPYDGLDQDCDGLSDYDADRDGSDSAIYGGEDCDDADDAVNPDAAELYYDGVDQDCDGRSDYDADGDGSDSDAWGGEDCDDDDELTGPGAPEAALDGLDQDCDGEDLEDASWLISVDASSYAGSAVAVADLSGDGVPELLISAPYANTQRGWIYAVAGDALPTADALSSTDLLVKGESTSDAVGAAMDARLDVDGDGYTDLLLGAPGLGSGGGVLGYLGPISGTLSGSSADLSTSNPATYADAGASVSWAGDVDGDGSEDLIYGAPLADVSGRDAGLAVLALGPAASLTDDAATLEGQYSSDYAGTRVVGAGDTDGDGLADLAISAPGHGAGGAVYILCGPISGTLDLSDADAKWKGNVSGDDLGEGLFGGFDADGDGYTDLWIGATGDSTGATGAGAVTLVEGPFTRKTEIEQGVAVVTGAGASDGVGAAIWWGDLDGQEGDDLLLGAPMAGALNAGLAWALTGPFDGVSSVHDAVATWTSSTAHGWAGAAVSAADLDQDGAVDAVIGASGSSSFASYGGSAFVMFGGW